MKLLCRILGHKLEFDGARPCPKGHPTCSQSVYRCKRCGTIEDHWSYAECNSRMLGIGDYEECGIVKDRKGMVHVLQEE
jgi:hypothetical protein